MKTFLIVYKSQHSDEITLTLRGEIEKPTLREALDEFYTECYVFVKYKDRDDFDLSELVDGAWVKTEICRVCGGGSYDDECAACGGTGQATDDKQLGRLS